MRAEARKRHTPQTTTPASHEYAARTPSISCHTAFGVLCDNSRRKGHSRSGARRQKIVMHRKEAPMIETLSGFPDNVVACRAGGHVSRQDYETVVIPAV